MKRLILLIALVAFGISGWLTRQSYAATAQSRAAALANVTDGAVATRQLNDLRSYVVSHSGSSVTVTLTGLYDQAVAQTQTAAVATPSAALYAQAQAACAGRANATVQAQCNQQYIQTHASPAQAASVPGPNLTDYTYRLIAPVVTLDLATLLMGLAFLCLVGLVIPALRPTTEF